MLETLWLAGMVFANLWATEGLKPPDFGVEVGIQEPVQTRTEFDWRIFQRVPYVNRLFREVGYSVDGGEFKRVGIDFGGIDGTALFPFCTEDSVSVGGPPTQQEILRAMPKAARGIPYIYEEFRDGIEIKTEKLVERVDAPLWFPLIGAAQVHHTHWKCTVYFTETIDATYPVSFRTQKRRAEVVYIDKDRIQLCSHQDIDNAKPANARASCPAGGVGSSTAKRAAVQFEQFTFPQAGGHYDTAGYPKHAFDKRDDPGLKVWCPQMGMMPAHEVAAPDVLRIESGRLTPKSPYKLQPLEVLVVECANAKSRMLFVITPQGTIDLGQPFGKISVAGLTLDDARRRIQEQMSRTLDQAMCVQVQLENARGLQQVKGEHLVRSDGTIRLGTYGSVHVQGMTPVQVKGAVEKHLSQYFVDPKVTVAVSAYQRKPPVADNPPVVRADYQQPVAKGNGDILAAADQALRDKDIVRAKQLYKIVANNTTDQNQKVYAMCRLDSLSRVTVQDNSSMTLNDVIRMSQKGVSSRIIVRQMELTGFVFRPTVDDIIMLHGAGVCEEVIAAMQDQPLRSPAVVPASRIPR